MIETFTAAMSHENGATNDDHYTYPHPPRRP